MTYDDIKIELEEMRGKPTPANHHRAQRLIRILIEMGIAPRRVGLSLRQLGLNPRALGKASRES
jgi:hypothetical protein